MVWMEATKLEQSIRTTRPPENECLLEIIALQASFLGKSEWAPDTYFSMIDISNWKVIYKSNPLKKESDPRWADLLCPIKVPMYKPILIQFSEQKSEKFLGEITIFPEVLATLFYACRQHNFVSVSLDLSTFETERGFEAKSIENLNPWAEGLANVPRKGSNTFIRGASSAVKKKKEHKSIQGGKVAFSYTIDF